MIITSIKGGLGNQLFQYACARALSIHLGHPVKLYIEKPFFSKTPREFMLDDIFQARFTYASPKDIHTVLGFEFPPLFIKFFSLNKFIKFRADNFVSEPHLNFWPELFELKQKNFFLSGYWQSYKYFNSYYKKFAHELNFNNSFLKKHKKNIYLNSITSSNSVSIHFRRGDYITKKKSKLFHGTCSLSYYKKSIDFIMQRIDSPIFFIFSDDTAWVKSHFNYLNLPFTFVENNNDAAIDFWLMSLCKNNILANSTFSWWAAWLNRNKSKIVIAPKKWFADPSKINPDLLQVSWYKI